MIKKCELKKAYITCFSAISFDNTLDDDKTWMAVSSSKIFPSDDDKTSRILSSISFSCLKIKKNSELYTAKYNIMIYS